MIKKYYRLRYDHSTLREWSAVAMVFALLLSGAIAEEPGGEVLTTSEEASGNSYHFPRPLLGRLVRRDGEANEDLVDTTVGTPTETSDPVLDRIWSWSTLYENYDSLFLQELSLFGRYHGQIYAVDSAQGSVNGREVRRSRLGMRAVFWDDFTAAASFNLSTDSGVNIIDNGNVDTLTLGWKPSDDFQVILGQQKPGFTYEYDTSSNRMLTFERSLIVNQMVPDKSPGLSAEGTLGKWSYQVGGYSGNDLGDDFGNGFGLAELGYDFSDMVDVEKLGVQFYYLYNSSSDATATAPYRNSASLSATFQQGRYSGLIQAVYGDGYGAISDARGVTVMPSMFIYEDKLQLVGRFQHAKSSMANGLAAQSRYEQDVPFITDMGRGDRYNAAYLGLNWYLYGRKMKIMTGAEYSSMYGGPDGGDFDGWTWFGGMRIDF